MSRNTLEILEIFFKNYQKLFQKILTIKLFWTKIISENSEKIEKRREIFWEASRNITEIFENYLKNFSKKVSVNFKGYYGEFQELFQENMFRNILKNFENYTRIFRKS